MQLMELKVSLPQSKQSTFPHHVLQILLILSSPLHLGLKFVVSLMSTNQNLACVPYMPHALPSQFLDFNTPIMWADKTNVETEKN